MDPVPAIAPSLKAGPVALRANLAGRAIHQEFDVSAAMFSDLSPKSRIRGVIAAVVGVSAPGPPLFLPVRDLPPRHDRRGAVPPHHPRGELADGRRGTARAEIPDYAHGAITPTSALVEAK